MKHETSQWNINIVASNFRYWATILYRSGCHFNSQLIQEWGLATVVSVMESYLILITLIKTFNFWLFVPVKDRLSSCVLSPRFIHSLGSCWAQVARWRLPRLVRPLRRVDTATLLSRVLTLGQSTSPTHTLGTYTTADMWQEHNVDDEFFQLLLTFLFIKSIITTRSSHLTKSKHQMSHVAFMSLHLPQICWVTRSNICLSQWASDC